MNRDTLINEINKLLPIEQMAIAMIILLNVLKYANTDEPVLKNELKTLLKHMGYQYE